MHPIAVELNDVLKGTIVERLLSDVGRRMFFPKGIVAQAAEAGKRGVRYNATQGIATTAREPQMLPSVARHYPTLSARQAGAYAPTGGVPALRIAWRRELLAKNPTLSAAAVPFSTPVVSAGITHAIAVVAELFADASTAVLTPRPFWGNYRLIFSERRGATMVGYPLFAPEGGGDRLATEALREAIAAQESKTVLCIFNFPHNPTGYTPRTEEVDELVDVLVAHANEGRRMVVLCDDAYFGLQYEAGLMRESLFARLANSHHNILAIKVDGATKEEFAWGFRVGFITCASKGLQEHHYEALDKKILGSIRGSLSNCNAAAQHVIHSALEAETHAAEKREIVEVIRARYQEVKRVLATYAEKHILTPLPFNSGYFVTLRCAGVDAEQLRASLLDQGVGIIAIDAEHIRVTYSTLDQEEIAPVFAKVFECAHALA